MFPLWRLDWLLVESAESGLEEGVPVACCLLYCWLQYLVQGIFELGAAVTVMTTVGHYSHSLYIHYSTVSLSLL
jgi:hypothetical protein